MRPKRLHQINPAALCLFSLATMLVYGRSVGFEFLNWDDQAMIVKSPMVLDGFTSLEGVFSTKELVRFMPISLIAFKTIYVVFGMDPAFFHGANVLLHALNALLLASLIRSVVARRLRWDSGYPATDRGRTLPFVLLLAAVWAWHPLRAETVGWATDLTYHLATLFFLISFHLLFRYYETRRRSFAAASVLALGLSVSTYPPALTWGLAVPVFWALLDEDRHGPLQSLTQWIKAMKSSALPALGCLLVSLPILAFTLYGRFNESGLWYGGDEGVAATADSLSLLERIANPIHSFAGMIQRMVLPVNLTPAWSPDEPRLISYFAVTALLLVVGWLHLNRRPWARKARIGVYVVFVTAVPTLSLTEGGFFRSDRMTHLLQIVAVLCIAIIVPAKWLVWRRAPRAGKGFHGLLAGCVLLWLPMTIHQLSIWKNTYTLCDHLETVPWVANDRSRSIQVDFIRADKLREDGRYAEARALFSELLERSSHPKLVIHAALTAAQSGNPAQAEALLRELLSRRPNKAAESFLKRIQDLSSE